MARKCNASTDHLDINSNAAYTVASGSCGGWVKNTTNITGTQGAIFGRISGANSGGFQMLQGGSNFFEVAAWDTGGTLQVDVGAGAVDLHDGNWHHVVWVFDTGSGNANTVYVDGVSRASGNSSASWAMNNQPIKWGSTGQAGNWTNLNAAFADWFFSSAKLTALEIAGLFNGERLWGLRSRISWWPIDGLQSPEPDLIGGINATINGSPSLASGPPITLFTPRMPAQFIPGAAGGGTKPYPPFQLRAA